MLNGRRIAGRTRLVGSVSGALLLLGSLTTVELAHAARSANGDPNRAPDSSRILVVVEQTTQNDRLVERVRQKLSTLDFWQVTLLAMLAERVSTSGRTPGSDVALLLLAALIVLD